jgi:hypothetical protein
MPYSDKRIAWGASRPFEDAPKTDARGGYDRRGPPSRKPAARLEDATDLQLVFHEQIPEAASSFSELGWLTTFEDVTPEFANEIIASWKEQKLSVFPPPQVGPDSPLICAIAALKNMASDNWREKWARAVDIVNSLSEDHAAFRTQSIGLEKPDGKLKGFGYPPGSIVVHMVAQTNLFNLTKSGRVPLQDVWVFYDTVCQKSKLALDALNRHHSTALQIAGAQGNLLFAEALLRHGAGNT